MRLPLILGTVAAVLPVTLSVSIIPANITIPNFIPAPEIQCTGRMVDQHHAALAKQRAIIWGVEHQIDMKDAVRWSHGNAVWWICNCGPWLGPVKERELEEFQQSLEATCGPNQSGWLWSHKWKKGFNLDVATAWQGARKRDMCPKPCIASRNWR